MRRVVITGIGVVTPIGNNVNDFYNSLLKGKHGFSEITAFDTSEFKVKIAAEVKGFEPELYMDKKEIRRTDRFCQLAIAAADEAVKDSNIKGAVSDERIGVYIGSGIGGMHTFEEEHSKLVNRGPSRVSPFMIPMMISNMGAGTLSILHGFKGPCQCVVTACATGSHCVGDAFRAIKHGYIDAAIAGGTEGTITPVSVAGFANMTALSTSADPDRASIPFDAERSGFVMGEGAGMLILEELESALKRGARIYAEIAGYGSTADAYHITSPDPDGIGAARSMSLAIEEAGLNPQDIDYINAHGTSTPINDRVETEAIKKALGKHAYKVAVNSTKSMTGHLLGAAGAVEAIVCALAVKDDRVHATVNYRVKDEGLDLDYVTEGTRETRVDAALSNSLGFGGHNATLLIKKFKQS